MARAPQRELVFLDTHVIAWLYDGLREAFSADAQHAIEEGTLLVSPMSELELTYLKEIGRFRPAAAAAVDALGRDIGVQRSSVPFRDAVRFAAEQSWTRDPFDRIIVGETLAAGARLVTRDAEILRNCSAAIW